MDIHNAGQTIIRLPQKLKEYAQPRPGTDEDLPASSPSAAVIGGAVEGFIAGGPIIAVAGGVGGYAGVKFGEKKGSFLAAIGAGAITGAALSTLAVCGISALGGAPLIAENLIAGGILGGLAGTAGTLSGSRRASTRDGVYGGYLTGLMTGALMHNPAMMIAGAVSGGIGGKAVKPMGRAILGAAAGCITGALTGVFGGPASIAVGAVTGALVGGIGATIGPPMRQVIRNATDDIADAAFNKINPAVKGKLGTKGKIALGAIAGALSLAPLGLIFGPLVGGILTGLGVAAGVGAVTGGLGTYKFLRDSNAQQQQQQQAPEVAGWKPAEPQAEPQKTQEQAG